MSPAGKIKSTFDFKVFDGILPLTDFITLEPSKKTSSYSEFFSPFNINVLVSPSLLTSLVFKFLVNITLSGIIIS